MKKIKIIKTIVFIMTIAFIIVLISVVNILAKNNNKMTSIDKNISIDQPLGSNIKNILTSDGYIYILVTGGNLTDRIVILNTNDGKIISNISLN